MSIDPEEDPRETLYRDFKNRLGREERDLYYDKDDLLDIYTYADDESDTYVMLEVVNLARRLFPDDEDFKLRRAIVLDSLGMYEEAYESIAGIKSSTPYARLVKARLMPSVGPRKRLELVSGIVDDAESLDEDDIIQISEIARMADCPSWLADNIERVKAKAEYMPTLFYELAMNSIEEGDYEVAMKMVEELVDAEPMKAEFWEMYAEVAYNLNDYDRAESGADYALAIDEDSKRASIIKGFVMILNGNVTEGRELVKNAYLDPEIGSAHAACLLAISYMDEPANAKKALIDYIDSCPIVSRETLTALAAIDYDAALGYVRDYVKDYSAMGEDSFVEWSAELTVAGAVNMAAVVLELFEKEENDARSIMFYENLYQAYYRASMYDRIIDRFGSMAQPLTLLATASWLAYVMSLARMEHFDRVMKVIGSVKNKIESMELSELMQVPSFEAEMRLSYLNVSLDRVTAVLCGGATMSLDDADPFLHVKSFIK